jgi:hypothetical protein
MALDESQKLANLVRLGFAIDFLQVNDLRDSRMCQDVMTSGGAREAKPETLSQAEHVAEGDVA